MTATLQPGGMLFTCHPDSLGAKAKARAGKTYEAGLGIRAAAVETPAPADTGPASFSVGGLLAAAWHEASHAAVAVALGCAVARLDVFLAADGEYSGVCELAAVPPDMAAAAVYQAAGEAADRAAGRGGSLSQTDRSRYEFMGELADVDAVARAGELLARPDVHALTWLIFNDLTDRRRLFAHDVERHVQTVRAAGGFTAPVESITPVETIHAE